MITWDSIMGIFAGSPKTTTNKPKADGNIESYSDVGRKTRKQISYHFMNGTIIPSVVLLSQKAIGKGLNIQSRTDSEKVNREFENLIKEHAKKKNFETTKQMSRDEALEMCISEKIRKGGVLVRHQYSNSWDIPYKVTLIGVDMIDVTKFDKSKNILNGLRKDARGAVVGYFIYTDETKMKSVEIAASEISSYMDKWLDISQYTAVSRLSQMLPDLDDILQYQKNELDAAGERSSSSVFWHTKMYDTVIDAMNELYQKLRVNKPFSNNVADNQERFAELTEINRSVMQQMSKDGITPGSFVKAIPKDDTITEIDNKTGSTFEPFNKNSLDKISSSQGWSSAGVMQDYIKTNWATIDALDGKEEDRHQAEVNKIQTHILEDYLERLFLIGVETKRISVTLKDYLSNRNKYHQWKVLRQSTSVLDERKKETANEKGLKNNTKTLVSIYEEKGLDYMDEQLKQTKIDIELEKKKRELYEKAGFEYPNDIEKDQEGNNSIQNKGEKDA